MLLEASHKVTISLLTKVYRKPKINKILKVARVVNGEIFAVKRPVVLYGLITKISEFESLFLGAVSKNNDVNTLKSLSCHTFDHCSKLDACSVAGF